MLYKFLGFFNLNFLVNFYKECKTNNKKNFEFSYKQLYILFVIFKRVYNLTFFEFILFYYFYLLLMFNRSKSYEHFFTLFILFKKTFFLKKLTFLRLGSNFLNFNLNFFKYKNNFFQKNFKFIKPLNLKQKKINFFFLGSKFKQPTLYKFTDFSKINKFKFFFLRKNKVYNKGRYSRNRQNYRTGVYLCFYVSVISIFGLYFMFFNFSFNFTYMWFLFFIFFSSFFFNKIVKYRLYNIKVVFSKFIDFFRWLGFLLK
jgi:hypothetical protein